MSYSKFSQKLHGLGLIAASLLLICYNSDAQPGPAPQPQESSDEQGQAASQEDIADTGQDPFDESAPIPSILDDFDPQNASFDAIIYKRKDFNDFYGKAIIIPFRYQARDR